MFDTGSSIVYVVSDKCEKCPQEHKYKQGDSKSFAATDGSTYHQSYGIGSITGTGAKDTFCFGQGTHCVPDVNFINVASGTDMDVDKFSGLIGLAPTGVDNKMPSFLS